MSDKPTEEEIAALVNRRSEGVTMEPSGYVFTDDGMDRYKVQTDDGESLQINTDGVNYIELTRRGLEALITFLDEQAELLNSDDCFVYFVRNERTRAIKIGRSGSPLDRLAALQTATPDDLSLEGVLPGNSDREAHFHKMFEPYHIRGEWFEDNEHLNLFIHNNFSDGGWKSDL